MSRGKPVGSGERRVFQFLIEQPQEWQGDWTTQGGSRARPAGNWAGGREPQNMESRVRFLLGGALECGFLSVGHQELGLSSLGLHLQEVSAQQSVESSVLFGGEYLAGQNFLPQILLILKKLSFENPIFLWLSLKCSGPWLPSGPLTCCSLCLRVDHFVLQDIYFLNIALDIIYLHC